MQINWKKMIIRYLCVFLLLFIFACGIEDIIMLFTKKWEWVNVGLLYFIELIILFIIIKKPED